jgi:CHAT domain-containing protein/tetratricopeptide (TPR) repeat protein
LLYLGRVRDSIALFEDAVSIREAANMPFLHAQALANLGEARLLLGEFGHALQALEKARAIFQQFPAAADLLIVTRKLGDAYASLNLLEEAQETYTEASALAAMLNMTHVHGWILWGLGAVLLRTGVSGEAGERLAQAAGIFAEADNRPLLSAVRLEQAALLEAQDDSSGAKSYADDAWALVAGSEWRVQQVYAALRQADLASEDAAQAEMWLQRADEIGAALDLPHLRFRVDARLGRLRSQQGNFDEAEALLLNAIEQVERIRGTLPQEVLRTSFVQDKMAVYEDLLRLYLTRGETGDLARAFDISERTRSRVLIDLVQGVVQRRLDLGNAEQAVLEALQADLNALYNRLLEGDNEQRGSGIRPLAALEQEIQRLRLRAATREDKNSSIRNSSQDSHDRADAGIAGTKAERWKLSSDGTNVRALLSRNSRLISYFSLDNQVGAFVSNHGRLQVVREVADIRAVQGLVARLNMQWDRFRIGKFLARSHLPHLEQSVRRLLGELYQLLWQPLAPLLEWNSSDSDDDRESRGKRGRQGGNPMPVTVVPHGILHQVPFHALYDGASYLVERYAMTYAPSATVHALCLKMPQRTRQRAVVAAVEDKRTPNVKIEADRVATLFPDCTKLSGDVATIERLRDTVQGQAGGKQADAVHLACHGLFRADNPIYSGLKLADGWLTASELVEWPMDGALVVLSACESGRSRVVAGDELLGLPRAVLGAGARTVVVSQWIVQDDAAAELMVAFHTAYLEHENAAVALRDAQRALAVKWAHPYFWAAFVVMGAS